MKNRFGDSLSDTLTRRLTDLFHPYELGWVQGPVAGIALGSVGASPGNLSQVPAHCSLFTFLGVSPP